MKVEHGTAPVVASGDHPAWCTVMSAHARNWKKCVCRRGPHGLHHRVWIGDADGLIHDRKFHGNGNMAKMQGSVAILISSLNKMMHPQANAKCHDKAQGPR